MAREPQNIFDVLANAFSTGGAQIAEHLDKKRQAGATALLKDFQMKIEQENQRREAMDQQIRLAQFRSASAKNDLEMQKLMSELTLMADPDKYNEYLSKMALAESAGRLAEIAARGAQDRQTGQFYIDKGLTGKGNAPSNTGGGASSIAQQRLLLNDRLNAQRKDILAGAPGGGFSNEGALFEENAANLSNKTMGMFAAPDSVLVPTVAALKKVGDVANVSATKDTLSAMFPGVFTAPVDSLMPHTTPTIPTQVTINGKTVDAPKSRAEIEKIKTTKPNLYGLLIKWADSVGLR